MSDRGRTRIQQDERDQINREREAKNLILQNAYKEVFSTEAGEVVFEDLIIQCGVFAPDIKKNADVYNKQGKREIGLHIMNMRDMNSPASMRSWLNGTFRRGEK